LSEKARYELVERKQAGTDYLYRVAGRKNRDAFQLLIAETSDEPCSWRKYLKGRLATLDPDR
jgi:hypothetical protein